MRDPVAFFPHVAQGSTAVAGERGYPAQGVSRFQLPSRQTTASASGSCVITSSGVTGAVIGMAPRCRVAVILLTCKGGVMLP